MERFNEIKGLLFNGFIGLLVGWGGFTQLFPNILEMLGDVAELGSYSALRIFSIVFFLSIIFLITSYWWIWGIDNYVESETVPDYKTSAFILSLGLKLYPIYCFINDPFSVHSSVEWFNFFELTIWYYLLIAIAELLLISLFFYPKSRGRLLKANTIIFSLDVVLGIGVVSFIEPWANYKTDFMYESVGVGVIYAAVCLMVYYRTRESKVESDYRDLVLGLLVIIFLLGIFPAVNYDFRLGIGGLVIVFIGVFTLGMFLFPSFMQRKSSLINLILITGIFVILLRLHGSMMAHSNKNYFEERKIASKMISDTKINPLSAFRYLRNTNEESDVLSSIDIKNIMELVEGNHKWVYIVKGLDLNGAYYNDSVLQTGGTINYKTWLELKEKQNVRAFFFKNYASNSGLENQSRINTFYDSNYRYIHTEIIDKVLKPIEVLKYQIPGDQFEKLETYYLSLIHI